VTGAVALAATTFPFSSRNTPSPSWQHCGSLLQHRLPSAHSVTRGNLLPLSSEGVSNESRCLCNQTCYLLYLQIWPQSSSHPLIRQGPRTNVFAPSPGLWQRPFERHVALGPQQVFELGHFVFRTNAVPLNE
jgi:hypothetical protein